MEYAPECEGCKAMYGNRKPPEEPPCDTCRVDILPENADALKVYLLTRSQYIMSFNGPVDINHIAVWEVIDRYNIVKPVETFERVIYCASRVIGDMMKKSKDSKDSD